MYGLADAVEDALDALDDRGVANEPEADQQRPRYKADDGPMGAREQDIAGQRQCEDHERLPDIAETRRSEDEPECAWIDSARPAVGHIAGRRHQPAEHAQGDDGRAPAGDAALPAVER